MADLSLQTILCPSWIFAAVLTSGETQACRSLHGSTLALHATGELFIIASISLNSDDTDGFLNFLCHLGTVLPETTFEERPKLRPLMEL